MPSLPVLYHPISPSTFGYSPLAPTCADGITAVSSKLLEVKKKQSDRWYRCTIQRIQKKSKAIFTNFPDIPFLFHASRHQRTLRWETKDLARWRGSIAVPGIARRAPIFRMSSTVHFGGSEIIQGYSPFLLPRSYTKKTKP